MVLCHLQRMSLFSLFSGPGRTEQVLAQAKSKAPLAGFKWCVECGSIRAPIVFHDVVDLIGVWIGPEKLFRVALCHMNRVSLFSKQTFGLYGMLNVEA